MRPTESEAGSIFFVVESFQEFEVLNRAAPNHWVAHYYFGFYFFFETRRTYRSHRHLGRQYRTRPGSLKFARAALRHRSGRGRFDSQPKKLATAPKIGFRSVVENVLLENADAGPGAKTAKLLQKSG